MSQFQPLPTVEEVVKIFEDNPELVPCSIAYKINTDNRVLCCVLGAIAYSKDKNFNWEEVNLTREEIYGEDIYLLEDSFSEGLRCDGKNRLKFINEADQRGYDIGIALQKYKGRK